MQTKRLISEDGTTAPMETDVAVIEHGTETYHLKKEWRGSFNLYRERENENMILVRRDHSVKAPWSDPTRDIFDAAIARAENAIERGDIVDA